MINYTAYILLLPSTYGSRCDEFTVYKFLQYNYGRELWTALLLLNWYAYKCSCSTRVVHGLLFIACFFCTSEADLLLFTLDNLDTEPTDTISGMQYKHLYVIVAYIQPNIDL